MWIISSLCPFSLSILCSNTDFLSCRTNKGTFYPTVSLTMSGTSSHTHTIFVSMRHLTLVSRTKWRHHAWSPTEPRKMNSRRNDSRQWEYNIRLTLETSPGWSSGQSLYTLTIIPFFCWNTNCQVNTGLSFRIGIKFQLCPRWQLVYNGAHSAVFFRTTPDSESSSTVSLWICINTCKDN